MSKKEDISPLQYIKGVGPRRAEALAKEGILTPKDILLFFPKSYIDRNVVPSIKALAYQLGNIDQMTTNQLLNDIKFRSEVTIIAKIMSIEEHSFGKSRRMLKLHLFDGSGGLANIIFWQGVEYFRKIYKAGETLVISGRPELDKFDMITFNHPEIEKIEPDDEEQYRSGKILPKYRMTEAMRTVGMNMRVFRNIIPNILEQEIPNIEDTLPAYLLEKNNLPDIQTAIRNLHFPDDTEILNRSRKRIKFEEILYYELSLALSHREIKEKEQGLTLNPKSPMARKLYESLPFELTGDQKKVIREIAEDFQSGRPMNRLLQGDVGSGKTIVALLTMLVAIENGYQTAFMAPTELLAEQHYHTIMKYLEIVNEQPNDSTDQQINKSTHISVVQLVGAQKAKARRNILEQISTGEANIIVGTHAMFQNEIEYNKLGLIVIDEQHRFGVAQRAELKNLGIKSHSNSKQINESTNQLNDIPLNPPLIRGNSTTKVTPHILVMTATPIPRTLSMTIYGDLDVSIIREMPKNRKPIITKVTFDSRLPDVYDFIRKEIHKGHQAFIVYPLVDVSEKLELKAATEHYERLKTEVFPEFSCGLLHGQMFWYEKDDSMKAFLNKEYQILVATTVIEVGIDIPNATIMMIENAERFGLSQLHQLRGRIGRGPDQSYCILVTKDQYQFVMRKNVNIEEERTSAIIRLKTMADTLDGFKIAEVDMQLRGPGDILGTRQSGLPDFKYLDLITDGDIITQARHEAFKIIEEDPHLRKPENISLRKEYLKRFGADRSFLDVA